MSSLSCSSLLVPISSPLCCCIHRPCSILSPCLVPSTSPCHCVVCLGCDCRRPFQQCDHGDCACHLHHRRTRVLGVSRTTMTETLAEEKRGLERLVLEVQQGLERYESRGKRDEDEEGKLWEKMEHMERKCQAMERALRMALVADPNAVARGGWKWKFEHAQQRCQGLKEDMQKLKDRQDARNREAQEREALFHRARGSRGKEKIDPESGEPSTADQIRMEEYDRNAKLSVMRSSRSLEETFAVGAAVLASMSDQRDRIKHAQRKALDVLHSVGLSDSLLRLIERKQTMDKLIVYGGMGVLLFLVLLLWYWMR